MNGMLRDFPGNTGVMNWWVWYYEHKVMDSILLAAKMQKILGQQGGKELKWSLFRYKSSPGAVCIGIDSNDNKFPSDLDVHPSDMAFQIPLLHWLC